MTWINSNEQVHVAVNVGNKWTILFFWLPVVVVTLDLHYICRQEFHQQYEPRQCNNGSILLQVHPQYELKSPIRKYWINQYVCYEWIFVHRFSHNRLHLRILLNIRLVDLYHASVRSHSVWFHPYEEGIACEVNGTKCELQIFNNHYKRLPYETPLVLHRRHLLILECIEETNSEHTSTYRYIQFLAIKREKKNIWWFIVFFFRIAARICHPEMFTYCLSRYCTVADKHCSVDPITAKNSWWSMQMFDPVNCNKINLF